MYCKNCGREFDAPYRWYSEEWDEDYVQCPFCHSEEICDEYEAEEEEELEEEELEEEELEEEELEEEELEEDE